MRLPVYPAPGPGEVLSSWVIRLAASNGLRPTQLTHRLGLPDFWQRDVDVTATGEMLERLAEATGCPVATLEQCTVTPLLTALHGPFRPDSSPRFLVASGRHRGAVQARGLPACPACLAQGQVLRHWRLTTTVVCETHGLPLVDRCGGCGAPVDHVRLYRDFSQRLRLVDRPFHRCSRCGEVLTSQAAGDLGAALYVQGLMTQAVTIGEVYWDGLLLPAGTFQAILDSVMRLHFPARAQTGEARWRPETSGVEARLPVVLAAGEDLREGLIGMLRRWRARGVRLHLVLRGDLPEWYRQVLRLGLSVDIQGLTPTWQTRGTYVFTDRQWRVVSAVLPPVPRTSRHGHPARAVLRAWLTRNLKHLSAAEWSGAWVGQVSAVAMSRRIREMAASGTLDLVIAQMLTLPECLPVLTAPGTVYALERLGSVHTEHLWTLMLEQAVRTLPSTCRAADGGAAVGAPAG